MIWRTVFLPNEPVQHLNSTYIYIRVNQNVATKNRKLKKKIAEKLNRMKKRGKKNDQDNNPE